MRGGGGSTADRETSAGAVDEHHRGIPAEPLRPYVAAYTGYRQRGVPPARHRGLPRRRVRRAARPGQVRGRLAGCPPSQWLAEEFRNVQAGNWLDEGA
jgi:hypothetical protein